jgi:arylsulfatase A-like enzyme
MAYLRMRCKGDKAKLTPFKSQTARTSKPTLIILAAVLVLAVTTSYFLRHRFHSSLPTKNVVLIVLDTVRADKLGCYGNQQGLTPEIDKFAKSAVRFDQFFSHAPWTLPSVASLFTSQYPSQHGAGGRLGAFTNLPDEAVTLAEVFRSTGAITGAITNILFLTETFGMTQGFDNVDSTTTINNISGRHARQTTTAAIDWLDQNQGKRFFLFVHYFDPHLIYDPPEPFRNRFADAREKKNKDFVFGTSDDVVALHNGKIQLSCDIVGRLEKLHNGEIAYTDSETGRLLDSISARGLDENTIVIITADHGEEFCDHGGFEHGHTLYNELLHVPLIIRIPESQDKIAGISINTTVRQIDIAPTICELAGIEPDSAFSGKSLAELIQGKKEPDRPVWCEGISWGPSGISWQKDGFKLIQLPSQMEWQLFNLKTDAHEQDNIADKIPRQCDEMKRDLQAVHQAISSPIKGSAGRKPKLNQKQIELLRSLGYVK